MEGKHLELKKKKKHFNTSSTSFEKILLNLENFHLKLSPHPIASTFDFLLMEIYPLQWLLGTEDVTAEA